MNNCKILTCAIMTMMLLSCGQKQKPSIESDSNGWKTYATTDYSIQFPGTWDLDDSGRMGMTFQVLSPQASTEDVFRENVNLVIQDLKGQKVKTLDQYAKYSISQIKVMMKGSNILSEERLNQNGQDIQRVVFNANQDGMSFIFEQYYLIKRNKAYVLTLTCEADSFEAYSTVGRKVLNTFITD